MANEGYHEPINELSDETRDMHRAIVSLMEGSPIHSFELPKKSEKAAEFKR